MQNGKAVDFEAQGNSLHECACSWVLIEGKWILRHACLTLAAPQQHEAPKFDKIRRNSPELRVSGRVISMI
jgi:hypothetical protein